jgi:hypothetical protein
MIRTWRLFARRGVSTWQLLAVLALGVLMAATLLASAPVYAGTMADLGLGFTIRDRLNDSPPTTTEFAYVPLQSAEGNALKDAVERRLDERLAWFLQSQSLYLRSSRFVVTKEGVATTALSPLGQLHALEGYEPHVKVVSGRLPEHSAAGAPIQVAFSQRAADSAGLKVGQAFTFAEDFDTCERYIPPPEAPPPPVCVATATVRFTFPAVVSAIVEPLDTNDPFWVLGASGYFDPVRVVPGAGIVVPMLTEPDTLRESFGGQHPTYPAYTSWRSFVDPEELSRTNYERAHDDIRALYDEFSPLGGGAFSALTDVLNAYGRSAHYQQAPLTILLLEVSAVALFYVVLVATFIVDRQADEIALLRSRGATIRQIGALYFMEGLLFGVPAILAAPFIAAGATAALGWTPVFEDVSHGELLPARIPAAAFGMAAIGVGLSLVAFVVPALLVARRSAVARRRDQARPGRSLMQRYYLDFVLSGVAILLLWELRERGSVFEPSPTGGVSSDPLLLASPAILVAAAAALLLRFYPIALRIISAVFARNAGPTLTVGFWQVIRSPGNYTRLALLLMMAIAVGTFAASYSRTADRAYQDRARYETGVQFRSSSTDSSLSVNGPAAEETLATVEGVERVSTVVRAPASPGTTGQSSRVLQVLAVDPKAAASMLWFRDDFSNLTLSRLLGNLGEPEPLRGRPLPMDSTGISVWVNATEIKSPVNLWARVVDNHRDYSMIELGTLDVSGWQEFRGKFRLRADDTLGPPLSLVSFVVTEPSNRFNAAKTVVLIDDVSAVNASGQLTSIETFETAASQWSLLPSRVTARDQFEVTTDQPHSGRSAGKMTRSPGGTGDVWGIYLQQPNVPLPVVASEGFSGATGIGVGQSGQIQIADILVPIRVQASYKLFPTLETIDGPSVVFNRDQLLSWFGTADVIGKIVLNEAWFELAPGTDTEHLELTLAAKYGMSGFLDQDQRLASIQSNPLIAAGGSGILFLAFLAILLLVSAALLLSLWMSVRRRRVEFAVLRTLGLSRGQVFRLLVFEYVIVAIVGLGAGAFLGLQIGSRMLSFLNVNDAGDRAEPSFIMQTDWLLVAAGAFIVLAVFAGAIAIASRFLSRTSDAQALRLE